MTHIFWMKGWMDDRLKQVKPGKVNMVWNSEYGDRHDKSLTWMLFLRGYNWRFYFSYSIQNHVFWIIFLDTTIIGILSHWMILKDFILARRVIVYNIFDSCHSTLYSVILSWNLKSSHCRFYPCSIKKVVVV